MTKICLEVERQNFCSTFQNDIFIDANICRYFDSTIRIMLNLLPSFIIYLCEMMTENNLNNATPCKVQVDHLKAWLRIINQQEDLTNISIALSSVDIQNQIKI